MDSQISHFADMEQFKFDSHSSDIEQFKIDSNFADFEQIKISPYSFVFTDFGQVSYFTVSGQDLSLPKAISTLSIWKKNSRIQEQRIGSGTGHVQLAGFPS